MPQQTFLPLLSLAVFMVFVAAGASHVIEHQSEPETVVTLLATPMGLPEPTLTPDQYREALADSRAFAQGRAAYEAGAYEDALNHYLEARREHPDNLMLLNHLALTTRRLGQVAEAEAFWQAVVDEDSTYAAAHLNLGVLYSQDGQVEQARTAYARALALNPNYARAQYNLGLLEARLTNWDAARTALTEAVRLSSGALKADASYHLGRSEAALANAEAARHAFRESIALRPDQVAPRVALAELVDDAEQRRILYEEVLRLEPDHPVALEHLNTLTE